MEKNYYLHQSAKDAYRGYILAYNSHQLKDIFNVHTLDLRAIAKSFGFSGPPRVSSNPLISFNGSLGWQICSRCLWKQISKATTHKFSLSSK